MVEPDSRKAGSLLLKDLALFNKAAVYWDTVVQPEIMTEIAKLIETFYKSSRWEGDAIPLGDLTSSSSFWLAPSSWRLDPKVEDHRWLAWFCFGRKGDRNSNSYEIAELFGLAEAEIAIRFELDGRLVGGARELPAFWKIPTVVKNVDNLVRDGWSQGNRGVLSYPLKLSAETLVRAWEQKDWSTSLDPLNKALTKLKQDIDKFTAIVNAARQRGGVRRT